MKLSLWPWRWITGVAAAIAFGLAWYSDHPNAAWWQFCLAGVIGTLTARLSYAAISQEITDRKKREEKP